MKTQIKPTSVVPSVPPEILQRHDVAWPKDTRFGSCARLLQSLWRQKSQLPIGHQKFEDGTSRPLGSRIAESHARAGFGFLTKDIASVVYMQLVHREMGALYDETRLWGNLLSSQGLTFNLFGMALSDIDFGNRYFRQLFPDLIEEVESVLFEHSPGRSVSTYTNDGTAFDLVVTFKDKAKRRCFIAIEVKYTESMSRGGRKTHDHLDAISEASGLYKDPGDENLTKDPLAQLRAEHLLASSMVKNGEYHKGYLCVIAPLGNREARACVKTYSTHLVETDRARIPFMAISVETCIAAIEAAGAPDLAKQLHSRYLDFSPILNEIGAWEPFKLAS